MTRSISNLAIRGMVVSSFAAHMTWVADLPPRCLARSVGCGAELSSFYPSRQVTTLSRRTGK
eukprot:6008311-Amphidinium_carterae.1